MKRIPFCICLFVFLVLILTSCQKEKELYTTPPWLGGTIVETLEEEGNYTIFLQLAEKAEYLEAIEKNLYTVFAADDDAFNEFFQERGITSIDDISESECKSLCALNLINTPRSSQQLIYDWINDGWQDSTSEYLSLFFRWPTSARFISQKEVVKYNNDYKGSELVIEGQNKYVSCFSSDFYGDYGGDVNGTDYTYFFPNTPWTGLHWFNAGVQGPEERCANGFIYHIDKVVPVMPSIEEYLRNNQDKFGVFYDMIQRFADYSASSVETVDGELKTYYRKSYNEIPDIALENGPQAGAYIRRNIFSSFIPPDDIFNEYLNTKLLSTFESIDSIPNVTLIYLLKGHITSNLSLPSKMEAEFFNSYGENLDFDPYDNVIDAQLLSNGAFFEIDHVMEPLAFQAVPGPMFYKKDYTTFLYALNTAKMIAAISLPDVPVTVFAPDNEKLNEYGVRFDKITEALQRRDVYGEWVVMTNAEITDFVNDHIIFANMDDLSGEEFLIMNSGTGVYLNNNTLIAGGNREAGDDAGLIEAINSNINGTLYLMDNVVKAPEENYARYIANNSDFSELFTLFADAGMVDTIIDPDTDIEYPRLRFLQTYTFWTAFLPDNNAIADARLAGLIPADPDELAEFLKYHFIPDEVISDLYPVSDDFPTTSLNSENENYTLFVDVQSKDLTVTDGSANVVTIDHATANDFVLDGIVHRISSVLKSE